MGKNKKVILRIYSRHDMDLVALRNIKEFDMNGAIKYALHQYIKGTPVKMQIPEIPDFTSTKFKASYTIFLNLDEEKDSDIISFLDTIKPYLKNAAIKTIFRASLLNLPSSVFNKANSVFTNDYTNALNKSIGDEVETSTFYKPVFKKKCYETKEERNKNKQNKAVKEKDKPKSKENVIEDITNQPLTYQNNKQVKAKESTVINVEADIKAITTNNDAHIHPQKNIRTSDVIPIEHYNNYSSSNNTSNAVIENTTIDTYDDFSNSANSFSSSNKVYKEDNNVNENYSEDDEFEDSYDVDMDFMNAFSSMLSQDW